LEVIHLNGQGLHSRKLSASIPQGIGTHSLEMRKSRFYDDTKSMNNELVKQALEIVENPHVLINLVSRRVRQLNAGGRPFIVDTGNLRVADIALLEIIEEKMGFEMPEIIKLVRPAGQNGKRPQGWLKTNGEKTNKRPDTTSGRGQSAAAA
jgi:DNA-directed RNA polymerase subunit omega